MPLTDFNMNVKRLKRLLNMTPCQVRLQRLKMEPKKISTEEVQYNFDKLAFLVNNRNVLTPIAVVPRFNINGSKRIKMSQLEICKSYVRAKPDPTDQGGRRNVQRFCRLSQPGPIIKEYSPSLFKNEAIEKLIRQLTAIKKREKSATSPPPPPYSYKYRNAKSKQKLVLPSTANCSWCKIEYSLNILKEHEEKCPSRVQHTELSKKSMTEDEMLESLGMVRKVTQVDVETASSSSSSMYEEASVAARLRNHNRAQIISHFKAWPIPICSDRGAGLLLRGKAVGKCADPQKSVRDYELFCSTREKRSQKMLRNVKFPVVQPRKTQKKKGQYQHKYTFTKKDRVHRNSELVIGLPSKAWPLLNKTRPLTIPIKKLSDVTIARMSKKEPAGPVKSNVVAINGKVPVIRMRFKGMLHGLFFFH